MRILLAIMLITSASSARGAEAIDVDVSNWHGCALYDSGDVYCFGQIVGNEFELPFTAYQVPELPPAVSIATGRFGGCSIDGPGRLWCWGYDFQRSHRSNKEIVSNIPFQVEGLPAVKSVAMGYAHICAITRSQEAWCWGGNACGEVGCGHEEPVSEPTKVPYSEGVQFISAGVNNTCATFPAGELVCWGSDNPTISGKPFIYESSEPLYLHKEYFGELASVSNGRNFACGIQLSGEITCWGANLMGQLGTETLREGMGSIGIGEVDGITSAVDIDADYFNACAIERREVICWGAPLFGTSENMSQPPTRVIGLSGATRVALGPQFGCAVLDGKVLCWGYAGFEGEAIIEGMTPENPVPVPGMPDR